jgi:nicotinamidase-related amidase
MAAKIDMVVIDPQVDFCDLPQNGAQLSVTGADADMRRVGDFIKKNRAKIDNLHITLDSHQLVHIAHPIFWRSPTTGQHPDPLTRITANDVNSGVWTTTKPSLTKYGIKYVESLERNNRYPLVIWPPHCLIGTPGQTVYEPIREAILSYCEQFATVNFVTKGSNTFTEHYSAIVAEVDPASIWSEIAPKNKHETDSSVLMNVAFLEMVNRADKVLICGEAGSHCLANTFRDAVNYFKGDQFAKKLVLLKDGTSPVPSFEGLQDQFINEMIARGMEVATTDTFMF